MPKLPTAEEVFGMRQIPQAQRNVIGYDTSAISQANIRAGQTIENVGQGMVKFGMSQLDEKERQQEKDIRDRERAEARLERENLKFDSILEARARSDYLLKSIELKEKIRSDPNFDMKSGLEEFSKIKQNYIGMFKTPEGTSAFENFDVNTVADLRYDLGGIVLQRQQNAFLADTDNQIERLATAMSQSKDQNEIAQMAQTMRALVKSKRAIPGINEEELAKQDRGVTKQTALASYYAMSDEEKARVLFGGQDEYYDSEKPSGADYGTVTRSIENNTGNPKAKNPNSSAMGIHQWTDATARQYGLLGKGFDYRGDAEKEEVAFKKYTEDNRVSLNASLGRNPTDAELYLAHQQGAGGAAALLSNPDTNAIEVLKSIGVSAKTARDSIINNGGNEDMTAGEFANKWISKYEEKAGGVSDRYKGTPLAHLDGETIEKLQAEYATGVLESNPQNLIDMIDAGEMKNVSPNVRMNLKDQAFARIERNKEIQKEQYLSEGIKKYSEMMDADKTDGLTYAEVVEFKIAAGQDQERLKVADALLKDMSKPINIKESSDEAKALYGEIMSDMSALMKDPETKKPVDGLTEMTRWYQRALENKSLFSREDWTRINNLKRVIEARTANVEQGMFWGRKDTLAKDPYVTAYDYADAFLETNTQFDTPENRFNIMSNIVPIADAMVQIQGTEPDADQLDMIGGAVVRGYIESIDPQFKGMKELPDKIILKNGQSVTVPKSLATAKAQAKVSAPQYRIMEDANGNRAKVYADGTIEEIQ